MIADDGERLECYQLLSAYKNLDDDTMILCYYDTMIL